MAETSINNIQSSYILPVLILVSVFLIGSASGRHFSRITNDYLEHEHRLLEQDVGYDHQNLKDRHLNRDLQQDWNDLVNHLNASSQQSDCNKNNKGPFCGTDNRMYNNLCDLEKANKDNNENEKPLYYGSCGDLREKWMGRQGCPGRKIDTAENIMSARCPFDFSPVCGSDGRTYGNVCHILDFACFNGVTISKTTCCGKCHG